MQDIVFTKTVSTQLNELCFVVPTDNLHIQTDEQIAALHIAEHLMLEGAGNLSSTDLDAVATNFGGELVGEIWRDKILFRFSFINVLQLRAETIFEDLLTRPHLSRSAIVHARHEVAEEQASRNLLDATTNKFYADNFSDKYRLTTDGTAEAIAQVSEEAILDMAHAMLSAKGKLFFASSTTNDHPEIRGLKDRYIEKDWRFNRPVLRKRSKPASYQAHEWNQVFPGFNVFKSAKEVYAFDFYFRDQTRIPGDISIHTLPGLLFWLMTGPSDLTAKLVTEQLETFMALNNSAKRSYLEIGEAFVRRDQASVTLTNRYAIEQWVYNMR
jgi:hypothetical protein